MSGQFWNGREVELLSRPEKSLPLKAAAFLESLTAKSNFNAAIGIWRVGQSASECHSKLASYQEIPDLDYIQQPKSKEPQIFCPGKNSEEIGCGDCCARCAPSVRRTNDLRVMSLGLRIFQDVEIVRKIKQSREVISLFECDLVRSNSVLFWPRWHKSGTKSRLNRIVTFSMKLRLCAQNQPRSFARCREQIIDADRGSR